MLDSCRAMEAEGFSVTYLPVKANGIINIKVTDPMFKSVETCYLSVWRFIFTSQNFTNSLKEFSTIFVGYAHSWPLHFVSVSLSLRNICSLGKITYYMVVDIVWLPVSSSAITDDVMFCLCCIIRTLRMLSPPLHL